jgi:hypothetical protein
VVKFCVALHLPVDAQILICKVMMGVSRYWSGAGINCCDKITLIIIAVSKWDSACGCPLRELLVSST